MSKRLGTVVAAVVFCAAVVAGRPATAQYRLCWGDVHGHSKLSDGKGTPEDFFTYARDVAKLDFVILTDHDFGHAPPWRMPKQDWDRIQAAADENTADGRFVAIAGYEWTSQPKYWTKEEPIYEGPVKYYNHKNVYFPSPLPYLFSAKDAAYCSPDPLAAAVAKHGGLVQNNHLTDGLEGRDQFDYDRSRDSIIVNTEIGPDSIRYHGKTYNLGSERLVQGFLKRGGKTGFVSGTDTHEGRPAARTAVYAKELSRQAIFEALGHRRNYAVSGARVALDFRIDGHFMGEEIESEGKPRISVEVRGTDSIAEVTVVRDGTVLRACAPGKKAASLQFVDDSFSGPSYYYARVTQVDADEDGNPSRAWSSPIWVKAKR